MHKCDTTLQPVSECATVHVQPQPVLFLVQARQEVQQRLKDLISLESELVNRDIQLSSLKEQLANEKVKLGNVHMRFTCFIACCHPRQSVSI
jgi:hypothetical protein